MPARVAAAAAAAAPCPGPLRAAAAAPPAGARDALVSAGQGGEQAALLIRTVGVHVTIRLQEYNFKRDQTKTQEGGAEVGNLGGTLGA